ncbi:MAG: hypothetical protein RJA22_2060 [Verrucomicrobiota bacterium]|jgi:hypothetical protein
MPEPDLAALRSLLATEAPADLGPGPRPGTIPLLPLQSRLDALLGRAGRGTAALRALILLWHDHHEPAHELVQDGSTADASYVHGILHRREPDPGNAGYWFHRVGRHAALAELARRVAPLLEADPALRGRLLPRGQWDPLAFIEACSAGEEEDLLRRVQAVEFEVLLEHLAAGR